MALHVTFVPDGNGKEDNPGASQDSSDQEL